MLKAFLVARVVVVTGVLSLTACGKAPFSIPETEQSALHLSPSGSTIEAGTSLQLHVSIEEGSSRDLGSGEVRWSSSAPNTVAVTGDGMVIGLAAGRADITAEFGGFQAVSTIAVVESHRTCAPGLRVPIQCPAV
jgi:uncharacterized protein YjdB